MTERTAAVVVSHQAQSRILGLSSSLFSNVRSLTTRLEL